MLFRKPEPDARLRVYYNSSVSLSLVAPIFTVAMLWVGINTLVHVTVVVLLFHACWLIFLVAKDCRPNIELWQAIGFLLLILPIVTFCFSKIDVAASYTTLDARFAKLSMALIGLPAFAMAYQVAALVNILRRLR